MQSLTVVPDDVRAIGRYVYQRAQELRGALTSAGREVEQLTSGGWKGDAATSFIRGWSECRDGGDRIIDTLSGLAAKLGVSADTYLERDTSTANAISSLKL